MTTSTVLEDVKRGVRKDGGTKGKTDGSKRKEMKSDDRPGHETCG